MKCLLIFTFILSVTVAQFYNPAMGYNSIFGTNSLGTAGTGFGTSGLGYDTVGMGYGTDGLGYGNNGLGYGSGSTAGERKTFNSATCNYLMGSSSILTFCSRFRQACSEVLVTSSAPANTIKVCDGCMLNFVLNCNNVQELAALGKK